VPDTAGQPGHTVRTEEYAVELAGDPRLPDDSIDHPSRVALDLGPGPADDHETRFFQSELPGLVLYECTFRRPVRIGVLHQTIGFSGKPMTSPEEVRTDATAAVSDHPGATADGRRTDDDGTSQ
jgi:hypothetical protein